MMRSLEKDNLVDSRRPKNEKVYELTERGRNLLDRILKRQRQRRNQEREGISYSSMIEEFISYFEDNSEEVAEAAVGRDFVRLDYRKLEKFNVELADELIQDPDTVLNAAEEAVRDLPELADLDEPKNVRVINISDIEIQSISELNSDQLGELVSIEGVIQSVSSTKSARRSAIFECSQCGDRYEKKQEDAAKLKSPYKCDCGSKKFKTIEEKYETIRLLQMKESPEKRSRNSITVVLEGDLAKDRDKNLDAIGSGIRVYGYLETYKHSKRSDYFDHRLKANNVEIEEDKWDSVDISQDDIEDFKELSQQDNLPGYLTNSLAHEDIHGLDLLKEAFLLFFLGRTEDGNTHFLCIGDPETAKSHLAKIVSEKFSRTTKTVAQGATEVGLTGTVKKNEITKQWEAQAGALPMADGGFHITDELDKLDQEDYTGFNETLSDQEVTLTKATIIGAKMSADVAEFSIGNPRGRAFDRMKPAHEQNFISMPDLNSRYPIKLAVKENRPEDEDAEEYERKKIRKINQRTSGSEAVDSLLSTDRVAKYIAYAQQFSPELSEDASTLLEKKYLELWRNQENQSTIIGPRFYEGLRNVAIAYAKMHLRDKVVERDVKLAESFMGRCLNSMDFNLGADDYKKLNNPVSESGSSIQRPKKELLEAFQELDAIGDSGIAQQASEVEDKTELDKDDFDEIWERMQSEGLIYEVEKGRFKLKSKAAPDQVIA
jgi:replicative DNA helicase Mcm